VVANLHGPKAGIEAVNAIHDLKALDSYYLFYAVLGELESRQENAESAARHFREALRLTDLKSERTFLSKRLRDCEGGL